MNAPIDAATRSKLKDKSQQVIILVCLLLLWGSYSASDTDRLIGYSAVTVAAFLPLILWLRRGSPGLPVYPIPALLYYVYYGLPILREVSEYLPGEKVRAAALTAALFISAATCAWFPFVYWVPSRRRNADEGVVQTSAMLGLMFPALSLGFVYHLLALSAGLAFLGTMNGVVRAIAIAASLVASYLLGHLRAKKAIDVGSFAMAVFLLGDIIVFSLVSLFLVTTIIYLLAALIGYSVTARQVPWRVGSAALVVLMILHLGKGEMRSRYWVENYAGYQSGVSVAIVPEFLTEWVIAGVSSITTGAYQSEQSLLERGSLLLLLLRVQNLTPDHIPFLDGESYSYLPEMLIPRFVAAAKTTSQASMQLLNIRYRFQTAAAASVTAIGWGLIAEAFANYGYTGVGMVGNLFGLLTGIINRISIGASALSWRNFVAVMGMLTLLNPEADLSYILTNLWQATIAITLFYIGLRFLGFRQSKPKGRAWQPS